MELQVGQTAKKLREIQLQIPQEHGSRHSITIGKKPEDVFRFFRNFQNFPLFMKDIKHVQVIDEKRSHWIVELKNNLKAEWDAQITSERLSEMISWKSIEGSEVETSGTVWFIPAPADRGTVVSLILDYKIPGGKLTEFLATFTGESPKILANTNLRRLKALLETGEIPTIEGQSSGREESSETIHKH